MHAENGAQFLTATNASLSAITVVSPITKINASEQSQRFDLTCSVSNFMELFWLYLSFAVWLSITHHFVCYSQNVVKRL